MTALATPEQAQLSRLISLVTDTLPSKNSKRSYAKALTEFLYWLRAERSDFTKAAVARFADVLRSQGKSAATINSRLAAIRKLASEAADNGHLRPETAEAVRRVKGQSRLGVRAGNWLTLAEAERLLNSPAQATIKGARDRAILAMLIGCGLRRDEICRLKWRDIQQRDGRWVIVDMIGKGGRIRTVPIPSWGKALLDHWLVALGGAIPVVNMADWFIFCPVLKGGRVIAGAELDASPIYRMVQEYCRAVNLTPVAPHDLRRTHAKLAHRGGAKLEQIQISLGHSSIKTTEVYLGLDQDFTDAPADHIHLRLER